MEKPMKDFMNDLADLMEQHGVEMDIVAHTHNYMFTLDGLSFTMRATYDPEADTMIGTNEEVIIPFDNITAKDVRSRVKHG